MIIPPQGRALRGALLALLALVALAVAPAGSAASVAPAPGGGLLRLIGITPAIEPGGQLGLRVGVTGAPPGRQLRLTLYGRTRTRSGFQATLGGASLGRPVAPPVLVPATPDGAGSVGVTIATDPAGAPPVLAMPDEGVFPLTVELVDGSSVLDRLLAYVVRLPTATDGIPLEVATVVPLYGPAGAAGNAAGAREAAVERASVLAARPAVPLTLDITPAWVASLAADPSTAAVLRSAVAGRSVARSAFVPVDVGAWLASRLDGELAEELTAGETATRSAVGAAPSSSAWIAADPTSADALRWLRDRGVRNVVVPETGLSKLDPARFPVTLAQPFQVEGVEGVTATVADAALSSHLTENEDPVVGANHALADLAILYFDQPKVRRFVVLSVPDATTATALDSLLAGLAQMRIVLPLGVESAFASVPVAGAKGEADGSRDPLVRKLDLPPPGAPSALASALRSTEAELATFSSTFVDGTALAAPLGARLLAAGDRRLAPDTALGELDGIRRDIRSALTAVEAPTRQTITFTARDGVVSFAVRNSSGSPINAVVHLQGSKLDFPGRPDGSLPIVLENGSTRVEVRVRTRASGDSPLDVRITTPDGRIELARTRVTIRSTAFSGVGVLLSVGAGAFLLGWWGKHIVKSRRSRRARHPAGRQGTTG